MRAGNAHGWLSRRCRSRCAASKHQRPPQSLDRKGGDSAKPRSAPPRAGRAYSQLAAQISAQVHHALAVAPLVVVPRDDLHHVVALRPRPRPPQAVPHAARAALSNAVSAMTLWTHQPPHACCCPSELVRLGLQPWLHAPTHAAAPSTGSLATARRSMSGKGHAERAGRIPRRAVSGMMNSGGRPAAGARAP